VEGASVVVTLGPGHQLATERFTTRPHISQGRLAKELGIHRTTLSFYENEVRTPAEGWAAFSVRYRTALKALVREQRAK
jgi:hypothetical protein